MIAGLPVADYRPRRAGAVVDERDARAWQSGVYYSNGTPKSSLAAVRDGALAAQDGTLAQCSVIKTTSNLSGVVFRDPTPTEPSTLEIDFSCALPCSYQAQVLDGRTGLVVTGATGRTGSPVVVSTRNRSLSLRFIMR